MKYDPQKALQKVIQLREERGLTITQVAKSIGYTEPNYSKIESGKIKLNLIHLLKFIDYYKVDLSVFFDEAELCPDQHKCQQVKEKFSWCYDMLEFCFKRLGYTDKELMERIIDDLRGKIKDFEIEERLGKKLQTPTQKKVNLPE